MLKRGSPSWGAILQIFHSCESGRVLIPPESVNGFLWWAQDNSLAFWRRFVGEFFAAPQSVFRLIIGTQVHEQGQHGSPGLGTSLGVVNGEILGECPGV